MNPDFSEIRRMTQTLLITGITGLVGSHIGEAALAEGYRLKSLIRPQSPHRDIVSDWPLDTINGDMGDVHALRTAMQDADALVHCAARVGDWGSEADYQKTNVADYEKLLQLWAETNPQGTLVLISSLGVYAPHDHFGTNETTPPELAGLDAYTRSKAEAEQLTHKYIEAGKINGTILRPGFIYGPRDRTVLPNLLNALSRRQVWFFGSGEQLLDNTYVKNLAEVVMIALRNEQAIGQTYNVTDGELVSRRSFIGEVARLAGYQIPARSIPLWLAKSLTYGVDRAARVLQLQNPPLLSKARYKFLGLHLEFSIAKAKKELGYNPQFSFTDAMQESIQWFRRNNLLPS